MVWVDFYTLGFEQLELTYVKFYDINLVSNEKPHFLFLFLENAGPNA